MTAYGSSCACSSTSRPESSSGVRAIIARSASSVATTVCSCAKPCCGEMVRKLVSSSGAASAIAPHRSTSAAASRASKVMTLRTTSPTG
jgi:hypothetical protein